MTFNRLRKISLLVMASAVLLSVVSSCDAKPDQSSVSSVDITVTETTSETAIISDNSIPDKVVATGFDVIDQEDNTE